jgi:hypothetical protein
MQLLVTGSILKLRYLHNCKTIACISKQQAKEQARFNARTLTEKNWQKIVIQVTRSISMKSNLFASQIEFSNDIL